VELRAAGSGSFGPPGTSRGVVIVAPASAGNTWRRWDDVDFVDQALRRAFERCRIDPGRVAVGGFSDGATYALSLGVANGDLFGAVMALSPGGVVSESVVGQARFFVAHGERDDVIPIERGGDQVVAALREFEYPVTYRKFPGGHKVPRGISEAAVRWFLRGG
jgi:phospholipase/carboxylesterase